MSQTPLLIDQVQFEPGGGTVVRLYLDPGTKSLAVQDPLLGSVLLAGLAGLKSVSQVLVVGKGGAGASYTTIQSALNAVPASSSAVNPHLILVLPGVYDETVTLVRDGVRLVGLGQPVLRSAVEATPDAPGADHTLIVSAQLGTIPKSLLIQGLDIRNAHTTKAALRFLGGTDSLIGSQGILVQDCRISADSTGGNSPVWATAVGSLEFRNVRFSEANNLGLFLVEEVGRLLVDGATGMGACSLQWDTAQALPDYPPAGMVLRGCPAIAENTAMPAPMSVECTGGNTFELSDCTLSGQLDLYGDQTAAIRSSTVGQIRIVDTMSVSVEQSRILAVSANPLATLDMPTKRGEVVFSGSTSESVEFDVPMGHMDYMVCLEIGSRPVGDETPWVTLKGSSGFNVNFQSAQTLTVVWTLLRFGG